MGSARASLSRNYKFDGIGRNKLRDMPMKSHVLLAMRKWTSADGSHRITGVMLQSFGVIVPTRSGG